MAYHVPAELDELMEKLLGSEKERFFSQVGESFPHTIRFNTLKGPEEALSAFLREQGFEFEPFTDLPNVYRIRYQPYPIGKSLSHFLGHFYVQDLASMLPPLVLDPQPGERVLDMSAAPGSKTTQMAALMENRGMILANDVVSKRLRALINNLQRMGVVNTAVVKMYGESFGNLYFETFDRILLDPACSGLGTLHKSPEVLSWWTPQHCVRLAASQKKLLRSAVRALKPGGVLVYSTCTLTPEENEEVIQEALENLPLELEEVNLPGLPTRPGLTAFEGKKYHPQLSRARRLYPFESHTEGFFIARLRKTAGMERNLRKKPKAPLQMKFLSANTAPVKKYLQFLQQHFGIPAAIFRQFRYQMGRNITALTPEVADFPFVTRPLRVGLNIAHPLSQVAKLTTEGVHLFGLLAKQNVVSLTDLARLERFVNRQSLEWFGEGHFQVLVTYRELPIGYGLVENGKFKSQFPKGEWPFRLLRRSNLPEGDSTPEEPAVS